MYNLAAYSNRLSLFTATRLLKMEYNFSYVNLNINVFLYRLNYYLLHNRLKPLFQEPYICHNHSRFICYTGIVLDHINALLILRN